ncbi:carbohydrate kinase family protein [Salinarimonas sp. NSM]|uniref:carbohydrate kinase family protein n=1 Tax=Salinarimonas sp. NSM TaxID=3458003 RepID=UPI00403670F2
MTPDLVTVGGLTIDNVVAADGTVALARAGGNGAYSAAGALAWVARVGLVSRAPASYPRTVLARLEAAGVDTSGVAASEARLAACHWFIYDEAGRREEGLQSTPEELAAAGFPTDRLTPEQVRAWRAALAQRIAPAGEIGYARFRVDNPLRPEDVPGPFLRARGVHLAPSQLAVVRAMLDRFAPTGMTIIADPGHQLVAHGLDELAPVLARLDAFLPSEVELAALVPGERPAAALAVLASRCPGAVGVKLGPQGVLVLDRATGTAVLVPAAPAETLDPTGAGDAFCGGFLAGLVETGDPVAAARFGAISAARIVEHFGADGALPVDRDAARAALARLSSSPSPSPETAPR